MKKLIRTIIIIINIVFYCNFLFLFMWLPLIDNKYDIAEAIKLVEKRELAEMPSFPTNKRELETFCYKI